MQGRSTTDVTRCYSGARTEAGRGYFIEEDTAEVDLLKFRNLFHPRKINLCSAHIGRGDDSVRNDATRASAKAVGTTQTSTS